MSWVAEFFALFQPVYFHSKEQAILVPEQVAIYVGFCLEDVILLIQYIVNYS